MFRTNDGGGTWQRAVVEGTAAYQIGGGPPTVRLSLDFVDPQHGWLIVIRRSGNLSDRSLHESSDGGMSWTSLPDPPNSESTIRFIGTLEGWATGGLPQIGFPGDDLLYHTTDGGRSWEQRSVSPPTETGLGSPWEYHLPVFANALDGVLPVELYKGCDIVGFFVTHDGGKHWDLQGGFATADRPPPAPREGIRAVDMSLWTVSAFGNSFRVTQDGGKTWSLVTADLSSVDTLGTIGSLIPLLASAEAGWGIVSSERCWGGGCTSARVLVKTADGGQTWAPLRNP
jgi:photosystem II stability/assembly factor-like uncharacterized protein